MQEAEQWNKKLKQKGALSSKALQHSTHEQDAVKDEKNGQKCLSSTFTKKKKKAKQ